MKTQVQFFFKAPNFSKQSIYSQIFWRTNSFNVSSKALLPFKTKPKTQNLSNNPHEEFCLSCKVSFEFLKGSPPTPPILKWCILNIWAMILNFPTQKQSLHLSVDECFILEGELLSQCRGCARVLPSTMEWCNSQLVSYFEECSPGVILNCDSIFSELHGTFGMLLIVAGLRAQMSHLLKPDKCWKSSRLKIGMKQGHFFNCKNWIEHPSPVPVISKALKNRQFSWKNRWFSVPYLWLFPYFWEPQLLYTNISLFKKICCMKTSS